MPAVLLPPTVTLTLTAVLAPPAAALRAAVGLDHADDVPVELRAPVAGSLIR
jgi:hypothetical protein